MRLQRTMTAEEEKQWERYMKAPKEPRSGPREPRYAHKALRLAVWKRDKGQCQYCGKITGLWTCNIDHVKPWPYGKTEISNLVVACKPCNKIKGRAKIPFNLWPL